MKKYLVTGGSGFIGSALVKRLTADGFAVRCLDDNSRGAASKLGDALNDIEFVQGDIRDPAAVRAATKGVDGVIHLAFVNGTEFFYSKPELVLDVGVRGMLNVLDACRAEGVGELVLASSSEVYQSPPTVPTDETAPLCVPDVLNPRYSYAGGKIISELLAVNYGRTGFDRVLIFRPHNVYGPDMGYEHVIPQLALRAAAAVREHPSGPVPLTLKGDGTQTRAFIHIDDFTESLMVLLDKGEHLNIYHLGNPEEVDIAALAGKIVACFGREARILPSQAPGGETSRRCPDIAKIAALGFRPTITLDAGLPDVVSWYAQHPRPL